MAASWTRVESSWAGLRSFVADGDLVGGLLAGRQHPAVDRIWTTS